MSDLQADPRASHELLERVLRAEQSLKRTVGSGVGRDEATRILRAWLTQLELEVDAAGVLAILEHSAEQADPDSPAEARRRVAVVADESGCGHGLANMLAQLRERGVSGHKVDVIGTAVEALSLRRYHLVHVCTAGPAGVVAVLLARAAGIPIVGSFHTDPRGPAQPGPGEDAPLDSMLSSFYGHCRVVLSPSRFADRSLRALGIPGDRIARWQGGVDRTRFSPACYGSDILRGAFNVLYVGRLAREKGVDLLVDAFQIARDRDPRLHLVLVGVGPEEQRLRRCLGRAASFIGWLEGEQLARVYASADLLVFPSSTDTFGQVVLEAQASGLPVLAADAGGAAELIENGRSGCLVAPEPAALASAIRGLARRAALQDRLVTGGLLAVRKRSWERSIEQLAAGYARALGESEIPQEVARAA